MLTVYSTEPSPGLHPDSQWGPVMFSQPHHCNSDLLYPQTYAGNTHIHNHVARVIPPHYQSEGERMEAEGIQIM